MGSFMFKSVIDEYVIKPVEKVRAAIVALLLPCADGADCRHRCCFLTCGALHCSS